MYRSAQVRRFLPLVLLWVSSTSCSIHFGSPPRPDPGGLFYELLSPHGEWLELQPVGPVWRPHRHVVGARFMPYVTGGRWVYTEHGWIFETDWGWGWVPFHYGRWLNLGEAEGWVWVPDTVWGPAWVDWGHGRGFVGWTPLPPLEVTDIIHGYKPQWCFVEARHFPNGRHREHVSLELGLGGPLSWFLSASSQASARRAGAVGPPPDWISRESSVELSPKKHSKPEPLPSSAARMPRGLHLRKLPPPT